MAICAPKIIHDGGHVGGRLQRFDRKTTNILTNQGNLQKTHCETRMWREKFDKVSFSDFKSTIFKEFKFFLKCCIRQYI